jgi:beta-glucosidase
MGIFKRCRRTPTATHSNRLKLARASLSSGAMKTVLVWVGGFFFALRLAGATLPIYHDGWIDLDKNGKKDVYEDPSQPIPRRVDDLLHRMTLEEKLGQLNQVDMEPDSATRYGERLAAGGLGGFLANGPAIENPALRNRLQHIVVEQSRLGIPMIAGHDSIHGFRTVFPIPLAQACAWEPELLERTQTIAARETDAAGLDWTFAPMVDLARDPRWGRIAEGFGEDPWLGALDAAAAVRGFQGINVAAPGHIVACLKHYVGYGAAEGGRDYNTTEIPDYTLRNFYLPPFKAGLDAGAWTVMSAFNALNGVPSSGNHFTLTDLLRGEWKFQGYVVSDWKSVEQLGQHGQASDAASAARLALTAGVDMEMVSTTYRDHLKDLVQRGVVPQKVVDAAVRRILTVKFAKGLFEHPYNDETLWETAFLQPDAIALAREAAAKSCVLLKNSPGALPLSRQVTNLALIGPLAEDADELVGSWCSRAHAADIVPLAEGIRAKLSPKAVLATAPGCALSEDGKPRFHVGDSREIKEPVFSGREGIDRAVAAARAAQVVVMALGERRDWSGEDAARSTLDLPGRQMELFEAVAAVGKPVVVVLFNGRPLALPALQAKAAAILEAWQPGVQAGHGVADVLFGDVPPTGRLTTSFPLSLGQLPVYYNHYNTGRPELGNYIDGPREPLYPFGFGLAYTAFDYGKVRLSSEVLEQGRTLTATVTVRNTGQADGTETVQLYIRALAFSAGARPVRELKAFQKARLAPGESKDLTFHLAAHDLGYFDAQGHWLVEPGKYLLWLARNAADGQPVAFQLK